jgi:hypothetical protein
MRPKEQAMNREDSMRFVQERLRHHPAPLGRELRMRHPPSVRRRFAIELPQGEHHKLERVDESVLVCCTSGVLWITHDGDPKDVILAGGDEYWAEREDAMHLFALRPCVIEIQFDDDVVEH